MAHETQKYINQKDLYKTFNDLREGKAVEGLALLKSCTAFGLIIGNAEIIEPDKFYHVKMTDCSCIVEPVSE